MLNIWVNIKILLLALVAISTTAVGQESEKKAIIEVIEGEHQAWLDRDFERFISFVHKSENILWGDGISMALKGYTEVSTTFKKWLEKSPEQFKPEKLENYKVSTAGDRAWVSLERRDQSGNLISIEQRILVKIDGDWKIAVMLVQWNRNEQ